MSMGSSTPGARPLMASSQSNKRILRNVLMLLGIMLGMYWIVGLLTPKVRDLHPEELRRAMNKGGLSIEKAIEQINRLEPRERRDVMQSPEAQQYIQSLPPEKRLALIRETMDRGIHQQIERFRKMTAEERSAFIEEMKKNQADFRERLKNESPERREELQRMLSGGGMQEVIERAVKSYLSFTSSEERAQLAPLFDGALENLNIAKSRPQNSNATSAGSGSAAGGP